MTSLCLSIEDVQEYIRDRAENNLLLDGEEFTPVVISLAMDLAVSAYNAMPPYTTYTVGSFTNKDIMMSGTLWKMFAGQAALLARNTMNYSDGGIQIPVEERFQLYESLAQMYQSDFLTNTRALKTHLNLEAGWGGVGSDYGNFPIW